RLAVHRALAAVQADKRRPVASKRFDRALPDANRVHANAGGDDREGHRDDTQAAAEERPERERSGDVRLEQRQSEQDAARAPPGVGGERRRERQRERQRGELQQRPSARPAPEQQRRQERESGARRRAADGEIREHRGKRDAGRDPHRDDQRPRQQSERRKNDERI